MGIPTSLTSFMQTFSVQHPVVWALLVMAVMAATSLTLYALWELALRLLSGNSPKRSGRGSSD